MAKAVISKSLQLTSKAALLATAGMAQAINVDGEVNDWLSTPLRDASDWESVLRRAILQIAEGQNSDYLDSGYGGLAYHVEAILAEQMNTSLNVTDSNPNASGWGDENDR
ncbi:MAG: hypothetical protein OI74_00445 [Gammaproteobacteria bacterium (ex Lamellibrachia satsuma)]|nr:MAG: hypothetical protein HPY30_17630 [Gammaproteobacteria bacterium (ex Lamellibrachia satsuma)]RRS35872.1 MAG: hypothetical protein OI74_00445 [Gammaproteobacteria bacterium (ex Lamellibrachia satsuma)]RRS36464.1 MAG: hypothetical protein NV67_06115 [Gammaproteobacteria bacterium (ex Lamellibrachia satsuma)]